MSVVGRCSIYEKRPQFCRDYPQPLHYLPEGCTFKFLGDKRAGECHAECCQEKCCCAIPREGGEPEGIAMDEFAGGLPCKHLVWAEAEDEMKTAEDEADSITSEIYDTLMPSIRGE
jgi:hypothetical protein